MAEVVSSESRELYLAVELLTGVEIARSVAARESLRSLGIPHITEVLCDPWDADSVVAAVFLAEAIQQLEICGVGRTKLIAKLRGDPDVWPTWAELRAAEMLTRISDDEISVKLDPSTKEGRQSDFSFGFPGFEQTFVEFKALGLSDREVAFCRHMTPLLESIRPKRGVCQVHTTIENSIPRINRAQRREGEQEAAKIALALPHHTRPFSGVAAIGHGTESSYLIRLRDRLLEALQQLPTDHESWVAFYFTNGAPTDEVMQVVDSVRLPANVLGLILLGSVVVFPDPLIHNFVMFGPGPQGESQVIQSLVDDDLAAFVLDRTEVSSGLRPTIVRWSMRGKQLDIIRRLGQERILPYNLILDVDPDRDRGRMMPLYA